MRCKSCHSYIPEGLASPVSCPQCGTPADAQAPAETARVTASEPQQPQDHLPFAPHFTIRTQLSRQPASISFGATGFSVVSDGGRSWDKFNYRDLGAVYVLEDTVRITIGATDKKLLFRSLARAQAFVELLGRVRDGLAPEEIARYQSRLT